MEAMNRSPFSGFAHSKASPNLDLLRSSAVLLVLADHLLATLGVARENRNLLYSVGNWGVLLFFVHTSLVLMMSLDRLSLNGVRLFTTFYVRRLFRIYPLSIVAVAVVIAARIPFISWGNLPYVFPSTATILSNFFLVQNLTGAPSVTGTLWSLPYEVEMYLLLPFLFLIARRKDWSWLLGGIWLGSVGLGMLSAHARWSFLSLFRLAAYVPCFLAGVIAYHLSRKAKRVSLGFWAWPLTLGIVTLAFWLSQNFYWKRYNGWAGCLLVGVLVCYCAESTHLWLNRITHYVAKYSYGLYLGQIPVLWLAFVKLSYLPAPLRWLVFLVGITSVPIASYHFIEKPFMDLGAKLTYSGTRAKAFSTSVVADPTETQAHTEEVVTTNT
jgi:peptidoglycan/LPS O-acetylase OafA/YrhL